MNKKQIAVFASGKGSNALNIIRHFQKSEVAEVSVLLCNNAQAAIVESCKQIGVPVFVFGKNEFFNSDVVLDLLIAKNIDCVVLAGFLWLVPPSIIRHFEDRMLNIHPALLPEFGGKGMYGMNVHKAVFESGKTQSGITIHLVNEHFDEGRIVVQKTCSIESCTSPEEVAAEVLALEHQWYPKVIEEFLKG